MLIAVLKLLKIFCLALWLLMVNSVANYDRLLDSLGHGEHICVRIVFKYFAILLIKIS